MSEQDQELIELKEFMLSECEKAYWDSMNQSMEKCEENDFKGPLEYGSKTLRKIQRLVREERG